MKNKRKIINFRFFVCLCALVVALIVFSVFVVNANLFKWIMVAVLGVSFVVLIVLGIIYKKRFLKILAIMFLAATIPLANLAIRQNNVDSYSDLNGTHALVSGRICENYSFSSSGNLKLTLDDVVISNADTSKSISGKIMVYVSPQNLEVYNFTLGKSVEVLGYVNLYSLDKENLSSLSSGKVGYMYCSFYNIWLSDDAPKISASEKLKNGIYHKLENSGMEYEGVGYAMITGDSSHIEERTLEIFRGSGIAHLLAVSGLHVSLIIILLNSVLKKFKASPKVRFILLFILLAFYSWLCGFSVSVLRASIMALVSLLCLCRGKAYDSLSALSFAAILIFIINPLKLFSISFVLSFGCVLAILLTAKPLSRLFEKIFYKKFADSLAICIGVQAGIFVLELAYFGYYPVLSIFSNLISVPLQSIAFMFLFVMLLVSLVLPFMSFAFKAFGMVTGIVVKLNNFICGLGLTLNFSITNFAVVILSFLAIFCLSDYIFVKKRWKAVSSLCFILAAVLVQVLLLI